jgi:hypothetical protein
MTKLRYASLGIRTNKMYSIVCMLIHAEELVCRWTWWPVLPSQVDGQEAMCLGCLS